MTEKYTLKELKDIATSVDLAGRSKKNKDELYESLVEAGHIKKGVKMVVARTEKKAKEYKSASRVVSPADSPAPKSPVSKKETVTLAGLKRMTKPDIIKLLNDVVKGHEGKMSMKKDELIDLAKRLLLPLSPKPGAKAKTPSPAGSPAVSRAESPVEKKKKKKATKAKTPSPAGSPAVSRAESPVEKKKKKKAAKAKTPSPAESPAVSRAASPVEKKKKKKAAKAKTPSPAESPAVSRAASPLEKKKKKKKATKAKTPSPAESPAASHVSSRAASPVKSLSTMTLPQLKGLFESQRGVKIGALKKAEIINLLESEQCDPMNDSFCSDMSNFCNVKYKTCVKDKEEKLLQIVINGHKIIGSAVAIKEIQRKMAAAGSPKVVAEPASPPKVVAKAASPPKVVAKPSSPAAFKPRPKPAKTPPVKSYRPVEDVLENISRPDVTTQEYRQNIERLKKCLGLMA
jgi:hypothetical protein